ncbi:MAG TPA: hypothetical protein VIV60_12060 [Polyangiaceae bacterium]
MKKTQILSVASFVLIISVPACNAKFVDIGSEGAGAGMSGIASSAGGANGVLCNYDGKSYPVGANFISSDGCDTCGCDNDGMVVCTSMGCQAGGAASVGGAGAVGGSSGLGGAMGTTSQCVFNGATYPVGAAVKSGDSCNSCSCTANGVACTTITCAVGGASAAGGSSGITCSYNGINYAVGNTFKASDGCNTCSCTASGLAVCTKMACQGAGGSTGASCPAIPTITPDCGTGKPIMSYDANGCPKGYVCSVCMAPKIDIPKCSTGASPTITYDANGCVNGYVCPSCPAINLALPYCGDSTKAIAATDVSGCVIGYACPSCSQARVTCNSAAPICPALQVPELNAAGNCYTGNCMPIGKCTCSVATDCPDTNSFTCNMSTKYCTPYLD